MLNIETITAEQKDEIKKLMEAGNNETALNRMLEIFRETTEKQQEIIKQLTEENQELKEKIAKIEKEQSEISDIMTEMEEMTEQFNKQRQENLIEVKK